MIFKESRKSTTTTIPEPNAPAIALQRYEQEKEIENALAEALFGRKDPTNTQTTAFQERAEAAAAEVHVPKIIAHCIQHRTEEIADGTSSNAHVTDTTTDPQTSIPTTLSPDRLLSRPHPTNQPTTRCLPWASRVGGAGNSLFTQTRIVQA